MEDHYRQRYFCRFSERGAFKRERGLLEVTEPLLEMEAMENLGEPEWVLQGQLRGRKPSSKGKDTWYINSIRLSHRRNLKAGSQ